MWNTKLGRCIYTSPSGYKVYQNPLYRWLTLGSSALQTVINRRKPQSPILYYLPALSLMARAYPNNSCLLGLGGAGIAHMLFDSKYTTTAIESSLEVIQIAQQFFMLDRIPNLTIIHQNALDFLMQSNTCFPHILVDLYDESHFPEDCQTDEFFIACYRRLAPDGFIAFNIANIKEQKTIFQMIKKQFKTTLVIPVKRCANMVIIASKSESNSDFLTGLKGTGEIKKLAWMEDWGNVAEM